MTESIHGSGGAYYTHISDPTQTQSAQRADFRPTLANRYSNWLAKRANPKVQSFAGVVNKLRDIELSGRSMLANGRANAARARIGLARQLDGMRPSVRGDEDVALRYAQMRSGQRDEVDTRAILKQERYKYKRAIGQDARQGDLKEGLDNATAKWRSDLDGLDFKPLDMSHAKVGQYRPNYLTSADGYAIKVSYARPSPFAMKASRQVSEQHQNGVTGSARQVRSAYQHLKLGVLNAALWAEQQANAARARQTDLSPGRRDQFMMAAQEAQAQRRVNREALKGDYALGDAVEQAADEREHLIADLRARRPEGTYVERSAPAGVAPPTVSRVAERAQAYSDAHFGRPVDSPRIKWMTSIADALSKAKAEHHERRVGAYQMRFKDEQDPQQQAALKRKIDAHEIRSGNASAKIAQRESAMQGGLRRALQNDSGLEQRFPRAGQDRMSAQQGQDWPLRDAPAPGQTTPPEMREVPPELRRAPGGTERFDSDLSEDVQREWADFTGAHFASSSPDADLPGAGRRSGSPDSTVSNDSEDLYSATPEPRRRS